MKRVVSFEEAQILIQTHFSLPYYDKVPRNAVIDYFRPIGGENEEEQFEQITVFPKKELVRFDYSRLYQSA